MTGPEENKEWMLSTPFPYLWFSARASRTIREIEGKTREPIDTTHTGQPPWEWSRDKEKRDGQQKILSMKILSQDISSPFYEWQTLEATLVVDYQRSEGILIESLHYKPL